MSYSNHIMVNNPTREKLSKYDVNYMIDQINHTRNFNCTMLTNDNMNEYAALMEAAKTLLVVCRILMDVYAFIVISVDLKSDRRIVQVVSTTYINGSKMYFHFEYHTDTNEFILGITKNATNYTCAYIPNDMLMRYSLNSTGILSYDMNFPCPTMFLTAFSKLVEKYTSKEIDSNETT